MSTKLYLLNGLSQDRKNALQQAGIPFSDWQAYGVLIEGKQTMRQALLTLNAEVLRSSTVYGNIKKLSLRFPVRRTVRPRGNMFTQPARAVRTRTDREITRQNYIRHASSRLNEMVANAQRVTNPAVTELPIAEQQLVDAARKCQYAGGVPENLAEIFEEELEAIKAVDKVLEVEPIPNGVLVRTETLYASIESKRYEIGQFAILIKYGGDGCGVYWFNQTRLVDGAKPRMNAPKVFNNGTGANDDLKPILLEHIGRGQLSLVADLAVQFIETADPADPLSQHVDKWPRVYTGANAQLTRRRFRLREILTHAKTLARNLLGRTRRNGG